MPRNIFIFLNIAICFLVIVSKRSFAGQVGSGIFTSGFTFSGSKDTISLDFHDDFENGNLEGWNPVEDWDVSSQGIISGTYSLKHAAASAAGTSVIFHSIEGDWNTNDMEWSFKLKNGNWDPSSSNKFWFYLSADTIFPEQTSGWAVGVNISGSSDLLLLWRIKKGKADSLVVQTDLDWNASDQIAIKIRRTTRGLWTVSYQREGETGEKSFSGTDPTLFDFRNVGLFFQYTATRSGQLWLDDVSVSHSEAALFIQKISLIGPNTISVVFNKPVSSASVQSGDFKLADEFERVVPILQVIQQDEQEVRIHFARVQGTELLCSLRSFGISGHVMQLSPLQLSTLSSEAGSVLLNEVQVNPFRRCRFC